MPTKQWKFYWIQCQSMKENSTVNNFRYLSATIQNIHLFWTKQRWHEINFLTDMSFSPHSSKLLALCLVLFWQRCQLGFSVNSIFFLSSTTFPCSWMVILEYVFYPFLQVTNEMSHRDFGKQQCSNWSNYWNDTIYEEITKKHIIYIIHRRNKKWQNCMKYMSW